jgi:hypothetical protein
VCVCVCVCVCVRACVLSMAKPAIEGVEMPGAKAHNDILGQFHLSLSQDQTFLELLQDLPARCAALDFCRFAVQTEVDMTGPQLQQAPDREALLQDVMDVARIEALFRLVPDGTAFRGIVKRLTPVFDECRAAMRDSHDVVRVCRGMELLCLVLRAMRSKRVGVLAFIDALGVEYDGEQLVRALIAQACRILEHPSSSNFSCTLALKLLTTLAGMRVSEKDGIVLQWLWEGGTLMVLTKLLVTQRRFRHCLSLDTAVLMVCIGLHNLSASAAAANNYGDLGDGINSVESMLSNLESAAVLGDVASNNLLAGKFRKATFLESVLLGSSVVHADAKTTGDLLAEDGVLTGSQVCYAEAFALFYYYLATRHRRQLTEAFLFHFPRQPPAADGSRACVSASGEGTGVVGVGVVGEGGEVLGNAVGAARNASSSSSSSAAACATTFDSPPGPDGLPLCFGSLILFLSLLLHRPSGRSARHAALVLRGVLALAEEESLAALLFRQADVSYKVFSTEADAEANRGIKEIGAGRTPAWVLAELVLAFMSDNMKLVLEIEVCTSSSFGLLSSVACVRPTDSRACLFQNEQTQRLGLLPSVLSALQSSALTLTPKS